MEQKSQTTLLEELQTLDKEDAGLLFRAEKERKKRTAWIGLIKFVCHKYYGWHNMQREGYRVISSYLTQGK